MSAPISPEHGASFDLARCAEELRREQTYTREGHAARTLVRSPDLRVMLVALAQGKSLAEHHARATVSVQGLSGRLRLQMPDRVVELRAGELLVLGMGLPHDVHAQEDAAFLLTLGVVAREA